MQELLEIIILCAFVFSLSCVENNNPINVLPVNNVTLVGTWTFQQSNSNFKHGIATFEDYNYSFLMLFKDGSYIRQNGNYSTKENQITFIDSSSNVSTFGTYTFSGDSVTFLLQNSNVGNYVQVLVRHENSIR